MSSIRRVEEECAFLKSSYTLRIYILDKEEVDEAERDIPTRYSAVTRNGAWCIEQE